MTAITATPVPTTSTATRRLTWRAGLATGAVAAAATTAFAAALRAVGVPLEVGAEPVPILGFTQLVLLGAVIGIVMARRMGRTTFVRAAVALTALSCVPSFALGDDVATKFGLALAHVFAAAIIVPRFARGTR